MVLVMSSISNCYCEGICIFIELHLNSTPLGLPIRVTFHVFAKHIEQLKAIRSFHVSSYKTFSMDHSNSN